MDSRNEPVRLVPHDPGWAARFQDEANRLRGTIGPWITGGVHHVGTTAVPGLDAKPIIDIAVGVESLQASRDCIAVLGQLDYLRAHPARAADYGALKGRWAAEHAEDREAYTSAKADFVESVTATARAWRADASTQ